jgi:hypothetical protein
VVRLTNGPLSLAREGLFNTPSRCTDWEKIKDGEALFAKVCELDLEGIVAKQSDSPYRAGRQPTWIKVKNRPTSEDKRASSSPCSSKASTRFTVMVLLCRRHCSQALVLTNN